LPKDVPAAEKSLRFIKELVDTEAVIGQLKVEFVAELSMEVASRGVRVTWYKDSAPLNTRSSLKHRSRVDKKTAKLTISNVQEADAGLYAVEIEASADGIVKSEARLIVVKVSKVLILFRAQPVAKALFHTQLGPFNSQQIFFGP
jgi:hypothetical protein